MDIEDTILAYLTLLGKPIRLPTAQWLFSDLLGLLDCTVRVHIGNLKTSGKIRMDNGGWIEVVQ